MRILGIETSCDETAASVVKNGTKVLSNVVASSSDMHTKTGGIIPENAARQQVISIIPVIEKALSEGIGWKIGSIPKIDAIAVTAGGPGLIGSMLIGVETAKTLSYAWNKPIIPVVHLFAHLYANWLNDKPYPKFPAVVLTVAGGHTDLFLMKDHGKFSWLGGTRDDAAGEAFDKTARLLGLPYPGGPSIQKSAEGGNKDSISLPRPLINSDDFDFSFSGLKTAVLREVSKGEKVKKSNFAAAIQESISDVLSAKTVKASVKYKAKTVLIAGGVAANKRLRELITERSKVPVFIPPISFCTDNATFIASHAYFNFNKIPWNKINTITDPFDAIQKYGNIKIQRK